MCVRKSYDCVSSIWHCIITFPFSLMERFIIALPQRWAQANHTRLSITLHKLSQNGRHYYCCRRGAVPECWIRAGAKYEVRKENVQDETQQWYNDFLCCFLIIFFPFLSTPLVVHKWQPFCEENKGWERVQADQWHLHLAVWALKITHVFFFFFVCLGSDCFLPDSLASVASALRN